MNMDLLEEGIHSGRAVIAMQLLKENGGQIISEDARKTAHGAAIPFAFYLRVNGDLGSYMVKLHLHFSIHKSKKRRLDSMNALTKLIAGDMKPALGVTEPGAISGLPSHHLPSLSLLTIQAPALPWQQQPPAPPHTGSRISLN